MVLVVTLVAVVSDCSHAVNVDSVAVLALLLLFSFLLLSLFLLLLLLPSQLLVASC